MKFNYFILIFLSFSLYSCDSDDDSDGDNDTTQANLDFFPLTANSNWTYNNQNDQAGPSQDSLYVAGTEMQNNTIYTNLEAAVPAAAFMTQFLSTNIVRTTDTQLFIDGALGAPIDGLPDITLPLNDFVLYDTAVDISVDPILGLSTGSITQDIMEIPVEINYGITSTMLMTPNDADESGAEVSSELRVEMEIVAMVPVGPITIPFTILESQDVLVVTNVYTDGIGLTSSLALVSFTLEDLSGLGVDLPFPENSSTTSSQTINTFSIGE